jgi:hypothetical protein
MLLIWFVQLKSCFGFDTFFAMDVRRFGDGGIFIGNLRRPIDEVIPKLEKKLSDEAGREVVLWFMEEQKDDITKQVLYLAMNFRSWSLYIYCSEHLQSKKVKNYNSLQ